MKTPKLVDHRIKRIAKAIHLHTAFLILLLSVGIQSAVSQNIESYDKIYKGMCYTSYYNNNLTGPSYVVYKVYKGGGKISRKGMRFTIPYVHFHYAGSGYDIGHLCPAKDFAYSRELEESTFRYYNAVPMTPNLNRGVWKCYEDSIRKLSQTDSLLVICGGCDYYGALVPRHCFKLVKSLRDGHIYYSLLFDNKMKNCKAYKCDNLIILLKDVKYNQ